MMSVMIRMVRANCSKRLWSRFLTFVLKLFDVMNIIQPAERSGRGDERPNCQPRQILKVGGLRMFAAFVHRLWIVPVLWLLPTSLFAAVTRIEVTSREPYADD